MLATLAFTVQQPGSEPLNVVSHVQALVSTGSFDTNRVCGSTHACFMYFPKLLFRNIGTGTGSIGPEQAALVATLRGHLGVPCTLTFIGSCLLKCSWCRLLSESNTAQPAI